MLMGAHLSENALRDPPRQAVTTQDDVGENLIRPESLLGLKPLISDVRVQAEQPAEQIQVVVAKRALPSGITIAESDLEVRQLPPEAVLYKHQTFSAIEDVILRMPRSEVLPGEILRVERLEREVSVSRMSTSIALGKRAMGIEMDEATPPLQLNDYVDIVLTRQIGSGTIVQRARVLAVNVEKNTVMVELTTNEVKRVRVGRAKGALHLVRRNALEVDVSEDIDEIREKILPELKKPRHAWGIIENNDRDIPFGHDHR